MPCAVQICLSYKIVWLACVCALAGVLATCANKRCLAIVRLERVDVTSDMNGRKKTAYEVQGVQQNQSGDFKCIFPLSMFISIEPTG